MADPKKGFLLRLPPPLFAALRSWAEQDMRSINGQIEWLLRDAVRRRGVTLAEETTEPLPDAPPASDADRP